MHSSPAESGPKTDTRSDPRTRLRVLPQARLWVLWALVLAGADLALGLSAKWTPGFSANEFSVDQELSRHHEVLLTGIAMTINYLFAPLVGVPIIILVALYLLVVRRSPVNAIAFGAVASLGWVASEIFKLIIARQRPNQALLLDPLAPETGSNSFPSGHVAFAVALAFAVFFIARNTRWSRTAAIAGPIVALVVAWSRVYVGVHYPTDVVASFLASSAAVILFAGLWNRYALVLLTRIPLLARFGPVGSSPNR
ncbi:phosphatase PAP2 family protein [Paenarthrobacter sp. Z7-10]|nr:phosphatase PAP2 family protein [Paenarthrobacter sp. Z7-10]